jgi:hypothetical protein
VAVKPERQAGSNESQKRREELLGVEFEPRARGGPVHSTVGAAHRRWSGSCEAPQLISHLILPRSRIYYYIDRNS